jgi:hypothetical protein
MWFLQFKKPCIEFFREQLVSAKCPFCRSVIYSRRNVLCGGCGRRLPRELLFTGLELERAEQELNEAKRRLHQASQERQAREARENHRT